VAPPLSAPDNELVGLLNPAFNCTGSMKGGFAMRAASAWPQSWRPSIRPALAVRAGGNVCVTFMEPRAANGALYRMGRLIAAVGGNAQRGGRRAMHRAPSWNVSWSALGDPARALAEFLQKSFLKFASKKTDPKKAIF
jgi:hypothetical protein